MKINSVVIFIQYGLNSNKFATAINSLLICTKSGLNWNNAVLNCTKSWLNVDKSAPTEHLPQVFNLILVHTVPVGGSLGTDPLCKVVIIAMEAISS